MGGMWPVLARSLRARPLRAVLTAIAVALGVAAVLGVQLALVALDDQAGLAASQRAGRSQLDVRAVAGRGLAPAQVVALARLPGVVEAQPLEEKRVTATAAGATDAVTVTLVGVSGEGEAALRPVVMLEGALPAPARGSRHEAALDTGVVDALGARAGHPVRVGDTVHLTTATGPDTFVLSGISAGTSGGAAFTRSSAFVTIADATGPFALGLRTPLVALRLASGVDAATVGAAARALLGPVAATSNPSLGVEQPIRQLRPLLALVVVLSVVIGAGVTANSIAVSAVERRRDIGLLRVAGASSRQVLVLFLGEAAVLAVAGVAAGVALGLALGEVLVQRLAPSDLHVPALTIAPGAVAAAAAAGLGAALLGALVPALGATRVTALTALRSSPSGGREKVSRSALVAPVVLLVAAAALLAVNRAESVAAGAAAGLCAIALLLPVVAPFLLRGLGALVAPVSPRGPVAAANLSRRPYRTGLVLGVLTVSVATAVSLGALTAGALDAGDGWVGHLFAGDAVVVSPATAQDAVGDQIATRASAAVGRLRFLNAAIDGSITGVTAVDVEPFQDHGGLQLVEGDRSTALARLTRDDAVLVPRALADAEGWHLGHTLSMDTGTGAGAVALTVAGVVDHGFPSGDGREGLVMGRDVAVRLFGPTATGFDDLQVVDGAARAGDLMAVAASYGMQVSTVADIQDAARRALSHSLQLLTALSWLGVAIAMLAVVNTLVVNVRQGTREIALLRAVGLSRAHALRLLLLEAALLAVAGSVIGILAGCAMAVPLLRASATTGFEPAFAVPIATVAIAAAAVLAGAVVAALVPARRATAVSIVAAIRYE